MRVLNNGVNVLLLVRAMVQLGFRFEIVCIFIFRLFVDFIAMKWVVCRIQDLIEEWREKITRKRMNVDDGSGESSGSIRLGGWRVY